MTCSPQILRLNGQSQRLCLYRVGFNVPCNFKATLRRARTTGTAECGLEVASDVLAIATFFSYLYP